MGLTQRIRPSAAQTAPTGYLSFLISVQLDRSHAPRGHALIDALRQRKTDAERGDNHLHAVQGLARCVDR